MRNTDVHAFTLLHYAGAWRFPFSPHRLSPILSLLSLALHAHAPILIFEFFQKLLHSSMIIFCLLSGIELMSTAVKVFVAE